MPEQKALAVLWALGLGEAKGRTKSIKYWVLRNMPPRFLSLAPIKRPNNTMLKASDKRPGNAGD